MSNAGTTTGACSRHSGMPVLSSCVRCGRDLCARCIVRTPVGFKCSECTGGEPKGANARRAGGPARDVNRPLRRGWPVISAIVGAAAVLAAAGGFVVTRSPGEAPRSVPVSRQPPGPSDIPIQLTGAPGHQLSGDLLLPARLAGARPVPGVVIVGDWGSVDRNGIVPAGSTLPDPLYADLARNLAAQGVASVRYDPAGQGQSALPPGTTLRFEDQVADAGAALDLMAARVGIDRAHLTVVGHGWGGLVAMQLAAVDRRVNRVVLISTPGRPVADTIADQLVATALSPADAQAQVQQLRRVVAALLAGAHLPDPATLETPLRPILLQSQEAYLRAILGLDPTSLAQRAHVAALIVRGGEDAGISAADTAQLAGAFGRAATVLVANRASRTLTITTRTVAAGPTTTLTPSGGMQNIHLPSVTVTASRDMATLGAITTWVGAA